MTPGVRVNRSLVIPDTEIDLKFTTSGGPGGQHANKAATRVEASWNVQASAVLGPRQRERIKRRLAGRIDSSGMIRLASDRSRSQMRNRDDVLRRLAAMVADALRPERRRIATSPSAEAKERRLRAKRRRAEIKRGRQPVAGE